MLSFFSFLKNFFQHFLLAIQFFTRIPIVNKLDAWLAFTPLKLQKSLAHLPAVGALVAVLCAIPLVFLYATLPQPLMGGANAWVAAIFSTALGLLLTGGFHEDGLADLADGLGGSYDRERALDIMKDSRIGAFGAMALILALLAKVALLALLLQVDWRIAVVALILAHVCSRFMPLWITYKLPHVGNTLRSKSKPITEHIAPATVGVAALWCLGAIGLAFFVALKAYWLWGAVGAFLGGMLVYHRLRSRLQGFTGDGLGAAQQLGELGFYLFVLMGMGPHPAF